MAVVDIFDALTSDRPYRKAMPHEKAIGILRQEAEEGKLDKFVVQKLEELIKWRFYSDPISNITIIFDRIFAK